MHAPYNVPPGTYSCALNKEQWPMLLTLALTKKCNMRCYMCASHSDDTAESAAEYKDMTEEIFVKIEPVISKVFCITLSRSGEPTVANHFLQRARRIRQLNPSVHLKITTNGLKLSSLEFTEKMIPLFDDIQLSLNGVKTYEEISGGHPFKDIKQSLENIKLVRQRLRAPCKFVISFVLMKKNLQDIVAAAVLAKEMGADGIWYKDLRVRNTVMKSESARHNPKLASLILQEVWKAAAVGIPLRCDLWSRAPKIDRLPAALKAGNIPKMFLGNWLLANESRIFIDKLSIFRKKLGINFENLYLPCYDPWESVNLFHDGKLSLCSKGRTYLGNIMEKSFRELWFGDEARHYREGIITGRYYKCCAHCKIAFRDNPKSYEK